MLQSLAYSWKSSISQSRTTYSRFRCVEIERCKEGLTGIDCLSRSYCDYFIRPSELKVTEEVLFDKNYHCAHGLIRHAPS